MLNIVKIFKSDIRLTPVLMPVTQITSPANTCNSLVELHSKKESSASKTFKEWHICLFVWKTAGSNFIFIHNLQLNISNAMISMCTCLYVQISTLPAKNGKHQVNEIHMRPSYPQPSLPFFLPSFLSFF